MSDLLRLTGMYSGIDTESVVAQLIEAKSTKVTKLKNDQTKLEWKQKEWQNLNTKIYKLYSKTLSTLRLEGSYKKKSTTCSDPTKVSVVASESASVGTQTIKVNQLAKSGYLTGAKLTPNTENVKQPDGTYKDQPVDWKQDDLLSRINSGLVGQKITVTTGTGTDAKTTEIEITSDMKICDLTDKLSQAGVRANFDTTNQRFFISSKKTGLENEFEISSTNMTDGSSALAALGLDENVADSGVTRIHAQDSEIELNGAKFTSGSNTLSVNGLTITAQGVTDEEVSIVTNLDTDNIYSTIKDFLTEYNDLIAELHTKYNADSARKYDVLTEDQKSSMSDEEVENWENKIKESLLRKDSTISSVINVMSSAMTKGYEVGGKTLYMSNFGIKTLNYFEAEEDERYGFHIDGDPDDDKTSTKTDYLKKAIAEDADGVAEFFSGVCKEMYTKLYDMMGSTQYSSIYKVYNDKQMSSEYETLSKKIKEEQKKVDAYEDKWFKKFSAMEVAMAKMQSNTNAVTSMLGSK